MLLRFRVENHRSLRDEQVLSMIATTSNELEGNVVRNAAGGLDVLRVAGIYGPNASGKSNVLSALGFMASAVADSQARWQPDQGIPRDPFLLDPDSADRPSLYEVDFEIDGVRYNYGFRVGSERVVEEWLYSYPQGRPRLLFSRDLAEQDGIEFGRGLSGPNRAVERLTRPNSLFLSAAGQNNHQALLPICRWFRSIARASDDGLLGLAHTEMLMNETVFFEPILRLLDAAGLGIVGAEIRARKVPPEVHSLLDRFRKTLGGVEPPTEDLEVPDLFLRHGASGRPEGVPLPLSAESAGTRAWLALLGPVVEALSKGTVLLVNDLEASLHPDLAVEVIRAFNDPKRNPKGAQLIFNTHEAVLLGMDVFRRDQIWFAEKDDTGGTRIYPLSDFSPRRKENLARGYLQGRYGAVPVLDMAWLPWSTERDEITKARS